jgi:hypothetical protein
LTEQDNQSFSERKKGSRLADYYQVTHKEIEVAARKYPAIPSRHAEIQKPLAPMFSCNNVKAISSEIVHFLCKNGEPRTGSDG